MGLLNTERTLENTQLPPKGPSMFLKKMSKEDELLASGARPDNGMNGSLNDSGTEHDSVLLTLVHF